ncbi:ROK family transcriptional regulator [Microbacterium murale]|uniref:Sugar kinase n=1 Tax=Microbacterium murale TaxID=1081040 RepID=A0ABQ1RH65_9MICO|nr:ROK family transcriptional regulator [Microbacterium murale]GGD70169.1 sugar kinase [Microbacterium murale]
MVFDTDVPSSPATVRGDARRAQPLQVSPGEVLEQIRDGRAQTISELAREFGVARSTVTDRIQTLLGAALINFADDEPTAGRGRPAGRFAFNAKAGSVLAAHVGMSGTMVALTDLAGNVVWSTQVQLDLQANGLDDLEGLLRKAFADALDTTDPRQLFAIGIGLPGDLEIGHQAHAGKPGATWVEGLRTRLEAEFGCMALVDKDVNCIAVGELTTMTVNPKVLVSLKVGTVIAAGLAIDGTIVQGAAGQFGEIGHIKITGNDRLCACGSVGCLNTVASGKALAEQLTAEGIAVDTARDVAELASRGVPEASRIVRRAGLTIGKVLATAINMLNPDVIAVWGYLVEAGDSFFAGLQEGIIRDALPASAREIRLERSHLGDNAGLRGAALAAINQALAPERVDARVIA